MAQMTPQELARYNAQREARIQQQNEYKRRNGLAITPGLSGGKDSSRTPWCTVTPGLRQRR